MSATLGFLTICGGLLYSRTDNPSSMVAWVTLLIGGCTLLFAFAQMIFGEAGRS